jgi:hypothetical protein
VRARPHRVDFGPTPLADAGPDPDPTRCAPVRLGTPGFPLLDYSWSPPGGLSDPTAPQPWADPGGLPTTYTLTVTDPTSGCVAADEVLVDVQPAPPLVQELRLFRSGSDLLLSWSVPAGWAVRAYSDTQASRARDASAASPTAVRECEGLDACTFPTPPGGIVFFQAVSACADGLTEGPN